MFIMLYKVVVNSASANEMLNCDHSNENHRLVPSCGAVYYAVQVGSTF